MKRARVFGAVLLGVLALALALATCYAFFNDRTISETENRTLAKCPELTAESWFSASFSREAEEFLSDHVLARDSLIRVAQRLEALFRHKAKITIVSGS